jgi:long-chain acyl-CoA synthetase
MFDEAAERFGAAPYACRMTDSGWEPVSFRDARGRCRRFAAWLLSTGFAKGDAVAVLAEGSPAWIMGELGLLMAGCVSVPLSIKLLEEEVPFRLNHSAARAVLTSRHQLRKVLGSFRSVENREIRVVYLDDDAEEARRIAVEMGVDSSRLTGFAEACAAGEDLLESGSARIEAAIAGVGEDDTVTICYTSGTTGNPKGIMLTHLNYWTNCHDAVKAFQLPEGWRTLIILPVDHSFAHTAGLYTSLLCGIALYFVDSRGGGIGTLRSIPINLLQSQSHLLLTVPALSGNFMKKIIAGVEEKGGIIERLFKAGIRAGIAFNGNGYNAPPLRVRLRNALPYLAARVVVFRAVRKKVFGSSMRFCVGGGAILDLKQQEFFAALGAPVYQGYGLTEATPIICANTPAKHKLGTSGALLESVECRLLRADGTEAGISETGEIVIRGGSVMKGYFGNPGATAEALRGGWLYTGDLAWRDKDGFLVVVGREKALLIAEDGEKYSPEEIEEAVCFSTNVIDQVMVWCDQRKHVTALVSLDTAVVERLAAARGIVSTDALLGILVDELNRFRTDPKAKKIPPAWVPAVFQIVPRGFSENDGTVNSTMKIVRHRITEVHRDLIDYSYTSEGSQTNNKRNAEALSAMFAFSQRGAS